VSAVHRLQWCRGSVTVATMRRDSCATEPPQPELSHAPPPLASPLPYTLLVRATFSSDVAGVGAGDLTVAADSGITVAAVTVVPLCGEICCCVQHCNVTRAYGARV
jgi:hypothetical protein